MKTSNQQRDMVLIIPVFNGKSYLDHTIQMLEQFSLTHHWLVDIIFVNDGSTDGTGEALLEIKKNTKLPIHVVSIPQNKGKGFAIQQGVVHVSEDCGLVAFTDVELPYGLDVIERARQYFFQDQQVDIVSGNRASAGNVAEQYSTYRKFWTKWFRVLLPRSVQDIPDTQCGLKVFRRDVAMNIFSN